MRASTPRELGLLVRERRRDLRLSQQDLAVRAGVSRSWLIGVEAGHPRAELGKLYALFGELGLTLDLAPTPTARQQDPDGKPRTVNLDELLDSHDARRRPRAAT